MRKLLFATASAMALMMGSAMANDSDVVQGGTGNDATVNQSGVGAGNDSTVNQQGTGGLVYVDQVGTGAGGNESQVFQRAQAAYGLVDVDQQGANNTSYVEQDIVNQFGEPSNLLLNERTSAYVTQDGDDNDARIEQGLSARVTRHWADIEQTGNANDGFISQNSTPGNARITHVEAKISQTGNENDGTITQWGIGTLSSGMDAYITQDGNNNIATTSQNNNDLSGSSSSTTTQSGDLNQAYVTQSGVNITSLVEQLSSNNIATVIQQGQSHDSTVRQLESGGHTATVTQTGMVGNTSNVNQTGSANTATVTQSN